MGHVVNKIPILPNVKGAKKAKEDLDKLVYGLIRERRESYEKESDTESYDDLLTCLLHAQDDTVAKSLQTEGGSKSVSNTSITGATAYGMSDKQVRDEVMIIFIAGHETTANALTWTFYLLSQNPDIEKKLLDELETVIESNCK
ncbi:MAG: cytochrome P450 [Nitrososphaeraceae archaeon]|nr:cytochrome P450 [Nitrososphaeraceae archaeon]